MRSNSAGAGRQALKGARNERDPESAAGQLLRIERDQLSDYGDAEGGDGEVVRAQPERERADEGRNGARRDHRAKPPDDDRQRETAEMPIARRRRQERGHIGADGDETRHPDVEQAGLSPLEVEAEADDGVDQSHRQEEADIGENAAKIGHQPDLPNRPAGLTMRTAISTTKATAARHCAPAN